MWNEYAHVRSSAEIPEKPEENILGRVTRSRLMPILGEEHNEVVFNGNDLWYKIWWDEGKEVAYVYSYYLKKHGPNRCIKDALVADH